MVLREEKNKKFEQELKDSLEIMQFDYYNAILEENANKIKFEKFSPKIKFKIIY